MVDGGGAHMNVEVIGRSCGSTRRQRSRRLRLGCIVEDVVRHHSVWSMTLVAAASQHGEAPPRQGHPWVGGCQNRSCQTREETDEAERKKEEPPRRIKDEHAAYSPVARHEAQVFGLTQARSGPVEQAVPRLLPGPTGRHGMAHKMVKGPMLGMAC